MKNRNFIVLNIFIFIIILFCFIDKVNNTCSQWIEGTGTQIFTGDPCNTDSSCCCNSLLGLLCLGWPCGNPCINFLCPINDSNPNVWIIQQSDICPYSTGFHVTVNPPLVTPWLPFKYSTSLNADFSIQQIIF